MNNTAHTLSVRGLGCVRQQRLLFSDLSFELHSHQLLLVEGENGAGKSSLMRLLACLATPANGEIHWNQSPLQETLSSDMNPLHFISHDNGLKLNLTVYENLQLACHLLDTPTNQIEFAIKTFNLIAQTHTLARQLSSGQQRRLALARLCLAKKTFMVTRRTTHCARSSHPKNIFGCDATTLGSRRHVHHHITPGITLRD